jgi:HEAT repeat protein/lysophospholipase L1-like esterase
VRPPTISKRSQRGKDSGAFALVAFRRDKLGRVKSRELAGSLALALGAGAVFLVLLEGGARLVERKRPPRREVADYIWDWDDKMPGGFYVMKSDGVGWPPWEEFNADGLRDRTRTRERPEGYRRIAFLGDSVTLGAELAPQEAYPQLLEARLAAEGRRTEVMSVALWGWSTRQERTAWQRIARAYRPDQAVLAVCLNDIPELQNNLARPPAWLVALNEHLALVRLLIDPQGREIDSVERLFAEPDSPRVQEALARFFEEVRALRRDVAQDGASFALVVFPFRFQVEPRAPAPAVQGRIASFCRDEELRCLDLLPTIAKLGTAAFRDYDHLSPTGHGLVADTLRTSGLLIEGDSDPALLRKGLEQAHAGDAVGAARLAAIARLMDTADPSLRQAAAWGLGSAGASAASHGGALASRLRSDDEPGVRMASARALGAIGSRAAAESLLGGLADPSESVRASAAWALYRIGPAAQDMPALTKALSSPDRYVAAFAAWSLGNLGSAAAPAVPQLVTALARDELNAVAAGALARIGPAAAAAVPELVRALGSEDDTRRFRAARTLGRIGPHAAAAVGPLTSALGDSSSVVRLHAARALGRIGSAAKPAAGALQRATGDRDAGVREEARKALDRLAGGAESRE